MMSILVCFIATITVLSLVNSFFVSNFGGRKSSSISTSWSRKSPAASSFQQSNTIRHRSWFGMAEETAGDASTSSSAGVDFTKFVLGQEYEGSLISSKKFGVFVDIGRGVNVLIPRSTMTRGVFDKLQRQVEAKSQDKIKIELTKVSEANRTLSGKYIPSNFKVRPDLTVLQDKVSSSKLYNATVVSAHDFGVFAEIDEFNVEGLIPSSKLPDKLPKGTIQASYPVGSSVVVKIDTVNVESKKLVLSMKTEVGRADVSQFENFPKEKWYQGVVQSVTNFGLFVRPAGFDAVGLVHQSRIPRELLSALKKVAPIAAGSNKTDVENLFGDGDIIRFRINAVSSETKKLELTMLPFRNMEEDDEDFATMEAAANEAEGAEENSRDRRKRDDGVIDAVDEDEEEIYDPQTTLLWWRGAAFKPIHDEDATAVVKDEEFEVLQESRDVVEGTWRRMFEVDMREDERDFSSKIQEAEEKELEEEIGELWGLDDEMVDSLGAGSAFSYNRVGGFISLDALPAEMREEMGYFKEIETIEKSKSALLKGGKQTERSEFESLMRSVESEIERQSQRTSKRAAVAAEENVAAAASVEPAASAPAEV